MTAKELCEKVLAAEEGVCHACRQHKLLTAAKVLARLLLKAIEQRDFWREHAVNDPWLSESDNAELDRIGFQTLAQVLLYVWLDKQNEKRNAKNREWFRNRDEGIL